jgi:hypothetical protein
VLHLWCRILKACGESSKCSRKRISPGNKVEENADSTKHEFYADRGYGGCRESLPDAVDAFSQKKQRACKLIGLWYIRVPTLWRYVWLQTSSTREWRVVPPCWQSCFSRRNAKSLCRRTP